MSAVIDAGPMWSDPDSQARQGYSVAGSREFVEREEFYRNVFAAFRFHLASSPAFRVLVALAVPGAVDQLDLGKRQRIVLNLIGLVPFVGTLIRAAFESQYKYMKDQFETAFPEMKKLEVP